MNRVTLSALALVAVTGGCSSTTTATTIPDATADASPEDATPDTTVDEAAVAEAASEAAAVPDATAGIDASADAPTDSAADADASAATGTPNCQATGPGLTNCGPNGESCCTSLEVPGGIFYRTYDLNSSEQPTLAADGGPTDLAHPATVSGFKLDKYEVTVGRFRQFVNAWNNGSGYTPAPGSGKHTYLNGGLGLAAAANADAGQTYEPGWVASDDSLVTPTDGNLGCDPSFATWTPVARNNENLPINCVDWWEAYAFCIWDGGFLPSEAEWEYAATGGSQQLEYPWGEADAGTNNQYAIYGCHYTNDAGTCSSAPVGTATLGAARWGHLDLLGNVWEWSLDFTGPYIDPCTDCADSFSSSHAPKGGGFDDGELFIVSSTIERATFSDRYYAFGFRCARTP